MRVWLCVVVRYVSGFWPLAKGMSQAFGHLLKSILSHMGTQSVVSRCAVQTLPSRLSEIQTFRPHP